jgi:hypothetical protein
VKFEDHDSTFFISTNLALLQETPLEPMNTGEKSLAINEGTWKL